MSRIILASASPRRKELLEQMGLEFEICPAKGEEKITSKIPHEVVLELSKQKALEVAAMVAEYDSRHKQIVTPCDKMIIGADTIVAYGEQILTKPVDEADAKRMLSLIAGKTHSVYTAVTVVLIDEQERAGLHSFYEKTDVTMYEMSEKEIDDYVATGEPMDKAGAYAIQGKCAIYIKRIDGDYNNVVGLPIARLHQEMKSLGIDMHLLYNSHI